MNKFVKRISVYLVAALISVGATYGTYKYLERSKPYSVADKYNYGNEFKQEKVHLANYTEDGHPDFTTAAEKTVHAVVHIKSVTKVEASQRESTPNPLEFFFGPGFGGKGYNYEPQPKFGSGSGVIISADGYIITNNHVIDGATELEVTLNDNSRYNARVIGTDTQTDIALIKIEGKDFPYVPFGDSDKLKVGEWVIAVGNPFDLTSTVTKGIVSAKARGLIGGDRNGIQSFIQTDAAINPGNSGGALVNTKGELVGINTAIYSQTGNFAGYGFAVPISIAGKVAADLKEFGTVQRAMLGVSIIDVSEAKSADPRIARGNKEYEKLLEERRDLTKDIKLNNGVLVAGFADQSPAKEAGILEKDVIVAVNGVKTPSSSILQEQVSRFRPGEKVKVEVDRFGKKMSFDIILKNNEGTTKIVKKEDGLSIVGAAFKDLSKERKESLGISYGVEVTGVDNDGEFYKNGIRKGFIIQKINNTKVDSVREVEQLINRAVNSQNDEDKALFIAGINQVGKRAFLIIELGK